MWSQYAYLYAIWQRNWLLYQFAIINNQQTLCMELISQYCTSLSVSLWNDYGDHVFYGVGLASFKSSPIVLCFYYLPFLYSLSMGWCCVAGVLELIGCKSLSPSLASPTTLNNNGNNNYGHDSNVTEQPSTSCHLSSAWHNILFYNSYLEQLLSQYELLLSLDLSYFFGVPVNDGKIGKISDVPDNLALFVGLCPQSR